MRSDAEVIFAARDDPDAFRILYDRYAARIHGFFHRRTGDRDAALDLTAETFAQAWVGKVRFRDLAGGSAGPWLFAIARRVLVASVRQRRLERRALEQLQLDRPDPPHAVRPNRSWLDGLDSDLEQALAELPTDQRQAVELRVLGDLPYTTIAMQLRCSSTAARIRVSRGLKRLRERMEMN
jgi:RNA polymerase sigma factor (sigma-70 family)